MQTLTNLPTNVKKNPAHGFWVCQVNSNYHDGRMTEEAAERAAGPQPARYIVDGRFYADTVEDAIELAASLVVDLVADLFAQVPA